VFGAFPFLMLLKQLLAGILELWRRRGGGGRLNRGKKREKVNTTMALEKKRWHKDMVFFNMLPVGSVAG